MMSATERLWVGLDVGGTKIEGVAVNDDGEVRGRVWVPTDARSADQVVESIIDALQRLFADLQAGPGSVAAIGLGIPGKVENGVVSNAVNLNMLSCPLASILTERFGVPVYLENDVRAAALGAYAWMRERRPVESMIYLSLGTGISAGVILNGRLHRGVNGLAGEVGHAILDPQGVRCKCGSVGCFETIASGPAIARQAQDALREALRRGETTRLGARPGTPVAVGSPAGDAAQILDTLPTLTAEDVFAAAREGDPLAQAVIRRVARFVSLAIYNLLMYYDVEVVALGGGVSHAGEVFFAPIREAMAHMSAESAVAREIFSATPAGEKLIFLPKDADPAWRGMVSLAMHNPVA
jgi:glucokinase